MSVLKEPPSVLLFSSFLYHQDKHSEAELISLFENEYGEYFFFPSSYFPMKAYYSPEMGDENKLARFFICAKKTFPRDILKMAKLQAQKVEEKFKSEGKRSVNWDVGIISIENLVLATGKNFTHRIYLGDGVFGDLTLLAKEGGYHELPWTYADYAHPTQIGIFNYLRNFLALQQKSIAKYDHIP